MLLSLQLDFAAQRNIERDRADGELHARRKRLVAFQLAFSNRFLHRMFDLVLRADADGFQELADAHIEGFFVHAGSPRCGSECVVTGTNASPAFSHGGWTGRTKSGLR